MAEERLIDDDKDRKYKIRMNADGEEELVIDDTPPEEERESMEFEVPELAEDDEEAAVMTPEQLAARDRARREAEEKRIADFKERVSFAKQLISDGKYEDCVYVLNEAQELERGSGEVYALKIIALTGNFADLSLHADECAEASEGFFEFADAEVKSEYSSIKEDAEKLQPVLIKEVASLNERNEEAKEARRNAFTKKRNNAAVALACTGIPFVILAVLAIYFSTVMHAVKDGTNMILFFVFLALAAVFLIPTLFFVHKFWDSSKLVVLNEKNSSSKLGREYEEKSVQLNTVEKILAAFKKDEQKETDNIEEI